MIYILGWNKRSWREAWDLEGEAGPGQGEDEGLREGRPSKRAGDNRPSNLMTVCEGER